MPKMPTFGQNLRANRRSKGISTRKLSSMVGKGSAYVSQIETGQIKSPEYETAYKLLKAVGYEEKKIDGILELFNIIDPEKEKAMIEYELQRIQDEEDMMNDPAYQEMRAEQDVEFWIEAQKNDAYGTNNAIHKKFEKFIDSNIDKTEVILDGLYSLLNGNRQDFDHLYQMMKKVNGNQKGDA